MWILALSNGQHKFENFKSEPGAAETTQSFVIVVIKSEILIGLPTPMNNDRS